MSPIAEPAIWDRSGFWLLDTAYAIAKKETSEIDLAFILGLLNSRLLTFFRKETGTPLRGVRVVRPDGRGNPHRRRGPLPMSGTEIELANG